MGNSLAVTGNGNPAPVAQSELSDIEKPAKKIIQDAGENSVSDHGASSQTSNGPTGGARESTPNKAPGYAEIEQMTEERLMSDPEYRELKEKLEMCGGLEAMFHLIDKNVGFRNDDKICLDDILALVNDTNQPNKELREAGKWLNDHREIWSAISKGDNLVGLHDVKDFLAGMKSELKGMKDSVRNDIKAENGVGASSSPSAATGTGAAPSTSQPTSSEPGQLFKAPTLSTKPGMEGAVENIGNTLTAIGNATSDLAAQLANPDLKPEERQKLQAKYNELQQLQSMLTAMYTQIQEAIANLMKMYSDVAKNSIQNMR